ncbi:MAG: hypothetical protein KAS87_02620 [Candidatus Omnitrophica bacterium]|nr:hypothetical protein [Candidatus Omnitrophota bacterium]
MDIVAVSWGFIIGIIIVAFVFMCVVTAVYLRSGTVHDKEKERKEWEKIIRKLFTKNRKKKKKKDEEKRKKNIYYHG